MNRIKTQANKLWQLIFSPSTSATYQQTLTTTWSILKETGLLLWLVVCLVLVLGDWFWNASYTTGQNARRWVENLQASDETTGGETSSSEILGKTGKSLLSVGQTGFAAALSTAKGQLGIETTDEPAPPAIALTPMPPKSTPVVTSPLPPTDTLEP
jgi:hypothetical protein